EVKSHLQAKQCQFTWNLPTGPIIKSIEYCPKLSYGPTDAVIDGKSTHSTDEGSKDIDLSCGSTQAYPEPLAVWSGIKCKDGNTARKCTVRLEGVLEHGRSITAHCELRNPHFDHVRAKAQHRLMITIAKPLILNCI
ncbi:hypothetical protein BaRGS_00019654, partial [Batillaria attramentaria]